MTVPSHHAGPSSASADVVKRRPCKAGPSAPRAAHHAGAPPGYLARSDRNLDPAPQIGRYVEVLPVEEIPVGLLEVPAALDFAETELVLRMDPCESLNESSRLREFQLLKTFEGVIPAPKGYWVDHEARYLPNPALICGFGIIGLVTYLLFRPRRAG